MLLKIDNPKMFVDAINIIAEIVTEVKIKINSAGLSISAIDPANVAFVSFKMPAQSFSEFEVSKEEILGINLDSFKSILRRAGLGSSIILQTEDNLLKIEIQDRIKRVFTLALIEIEAEEKAAPSLDFIAKIEIDVINLVEAIEDCNVVSDACNFEVSDGKFIIQAKGLNSSKSEFSSDEAKIEAKNAKSKYSLEYLQKFIKAGKLTDKAIVNFGKDYPLRLDFKNSQLELSFILAPRVETED